ncbi:hypothetical protein [Mucilaginibacter sp. UR6-11]|uniref:hypothetical protein n=1 Tax=Mucilaginibacter sp. UR6-11 TaxID=1435644 RepID=UPI001E5EC2D0|nr:hypothetical protein [Mucilaginibacter sp. UR6-11]MCC8426116.1 hypothetical protein [Mucilaginibacter sp. UR6-11]
MPNNLSENKTQDYLNQKANKKKTGNRALWVFLVFIFIAITVVVKITLTGSLKPEFFKGMPGSDDVYAVAKEFIRPTLRSSGVTFADSKYKFGKQADSVYVIQSSVESTNDNGEKINTEFKIILKYNGGQVDKQKNWTLIDLSEH